MPVEKGKFWAGLWSHTGWGDSTSWQAANSRQLGQWNRKNGRQQIWDCICEFSTVSRLRNGGCMKSDTCREKLKGKREVYCHSDPFTLSSSWLKIICVAGLWCVRGNFSLCLSYWGIFLIRRMLAVCLYVSSCTSSSTEADNVVIFALLAYLSFLCLLLLLLHWLLMLLL